MIYASNYISSKIMVTYKDGFVFNDITPQSISEMLRWPLNLDCEMLNEIILSKFFSSTFR
jgi:hypothetical protein